jgi:tRNA dimethylallyltransferase
MKKPLIILTGPTAVGKTELSVKLAKALQGEIISADSIQVYKYMDIGSAKVTKEEMEGVKHYLIDELMPDEEFNIFYFKEKAKEYVNEIYKNNHIPIVAGGTGFYIQSLLYDIEFKNEESNDQIRNELYQLYEKQGAAYIHNMLKEIDPESAAAIHENNVKRVIRAIEYYQLNGEKISTHNDREKQKNSPYKFKYYCLNMDRKLLYERINKRVDIMVENGLVEEVKSLLNMGYSKNLVSMQGIGYKEIILYLEGNITLEEAVEMIKQETRRFAKRQLTWFRREKEVTFINYEDFDFDKEKVLEFMINDINQMLKEEK